MNNWRFLLLAVIAVLQPVPSFTEGNLLDGRRECCDHRSNVIAPDIGLHGDFGKGSLDNRRLEHRTDIREERQDRYDATRSRERVTLERTERRNSPSTRSSTDSRFARDQERRARVFEARDGVFYRIQDTRPSQYERDVLYSKRISMSREDLRTNLGNQRLYRDSVESRRGLTSEERRHASAEKETMAVFRRERDYVIRNSIQRDSRFNSVSQLDKTRDRRTLAVRRNNENENRISRSLNSRLNSYNEREALRERRRTTERIAGERRQQDQNREVSDRTNVIHRTGERVDRLRRDVREFREREIDATRQRESRLSRERSSTLRESNLPEESGKPRQVIVKRLTRDSQLDTRTSRNLRNDVRRSSENSLQLSRNLAAERDERSARYRRDVRSMERLDESREREFRMSRDRRVSLRESRNDIHRREARIAVSSRSDRESRIREDTERFDVNRREREHRISRERTHIRQARDNERRKERESVDRRESLLIQRSSSDERNREITVREKVSDARQVLDENRVSRDRIVAGRQVTERQPRYNNRLTSRNTAERVVRSETYEDERRDMSRERDEIRESRHRISAARLSRERNADRRLEVRKTAMDSRMRVRREVTRNRGDVRLGERFEVRRENNDRVHRDRVAIQSRDIRATRLFDERRGATTLNRNMEIRDDRRSNRDDTRTSRLVRDNRSASRQVEIREDKATRIQAKARAFDNILDDQANKNHRSETRLAKRETMENRLRNFESARFRDMDAAEKPEGNAMNWQIVFYTLQGAYLCSLLMKMLTEKTTKGKTWMFTTWATSKDLIKVD